MNGYGSLRLKYSLTSYPIAARFILFGSCPASSRTFASSIWLITPVYPSCLRWLLFSSVGVLIYKRISGFTEHSMLTFAIRDWQDYWHTLLANYLISPPESSLCRSPDLEIFLDISSLWRIFPAMDVAAYLSQCYHYLRQLVSALGQRFLEACLPQFHSLKHDQSPTGDVPL